MKFIIRLTESMTGFADSIRGVARKVSFGSDRRLMRVCQGVLFCVIIGICLADLGKKNIILTTTDEFGYWANAAFFIGLDWSEVSSSIPYYAYGYSLWLAPLLAICGSSIMAYRASIVLNALFLGIGFLVLYRVGQLLLPEISKMLVMTMAFCVTLYSGNVYISQFSFGECLLWLLMVLTVYFLVNALESSKMCYFVMLCLITSYIFMVHMRTLGISIALLLTIFVYCFSRKGEWRKLFLAAALIVILSAAVLLLKDVIIDFVYSGENARNTNDFSGQAGKIKDFFSWRGLVSFGENVLGELFYLGSATFYVFYFGLLYLLKEGIGFIRSLLGTGKNGNARSLVYIFLLFSLAINIAIASVSLQGRSRIDLMIYGRYNEYILPVILILGVVELMRNRKRLLWFIPFLAFQIMVAFLYCHVYRGGRGEPVLMAIPGLLGWIFSTERTMVADFEFLICYKSGVIALAFITLFYINLKKIKGFMPYVISAACAVGWLLMEQRACTVTPLGVTVKYVDAATILNGAWDRHNVYYVTSQKDREDWYGSTAINYLQFMIPACQIQAIDYSEIDMLQESDIVVLMAATEKPEAVEERYATLWTSGLQILAEKDSVNERIIANNRDRVLDEKNK